MIWVFVSVLFAQEAEVIDEVIPPEMDLVDEIAVQEQIAVQREATASAVMEVQAFQSLLLDQLRLRDNPGATWCCGLQDIPDPSVYLLQDAPSSLVVLPGEEAPLWVVPVQEDKAEPASESP